ncbi:hypothetical protein ACSQHD_003096 [Yersinia enterocolitica]
MNNIEELKKVALAATPGPWEKCDSYGPNENGTCISAVERPDLMIASTTGYYGRVGGIANTHFIALANPAVILDLIAQLEAAQKLNPLSVNVSELEATYIGDIRLHMAAISNWKLRAETAEAELSAANEKLSKPVVLPEAYAVRAGHPINEGERNVMIPKQGGNWLSRFDVEHAIRAAGGKVEGE